MRHLGAIKKDNQSHRNGRSELFEKDNNAQHVAAKDVDITNYNTAYKYQIKYVWLTEHSVRENYTSNEM